MKIKRGSISDINIEIQMPMPPSTLVNINAPKTANMNSSKNVIIDGSVYAFQDEYSIEV